MKQVSFVLTQENDVKFYLRGTFEFEGEDVQNEVFFRIVKFMERVKRFKMKTNFKFGKKFTIDMKCDGKTYRSTDLFFEFDDSGTDFKGGIRLNKNNTFRLHEVLTEMVES